MIERNGQPDDDEREQHAISILAGESGQPIEVVAEVYRSKLAELAADAVVHDYLILLAARRTREALLGADGARS